MSAAGPFWKRLSWLLLIWSAGVAALFAVSLVLRFLLHAGVP